MERKNLSNGKILDVISLGLLVRQYRKSMKLTQGEFAGLSGVGTRFISDLENGKPTIRFEKVLKVLTNLGLELHILKR